MADVRVRFAPSPTGPLHIGGVRTALYNYLFARQHGGRFILRIEDTDQKRFVPGAEAYILEALQWLGIAPDEGPHQVPATDSLGPYRQSERKAIYKQYADQLLADGHAYYAFDTEAELEAMRERLQQANAKLLGYSYLSREHMANSLALPADEVQARLERGDPYVVRMKMNRAGEVRFEDAVRGWVTVAQNQLDDKVLLKADGMPTYHLANVVDDHLMGITHVIRGEEWLPSTPLHVMMYAAFGWEMPTFAHLPLLLKPEGKGKLSKRDGDKAGFPVFPLAWNDPTSHEISRGFREDGYLPEALLNFLALLGWHPSGDDELFDLPGLVAAFSLDRVGKAGAKFAIEKLRHFNQHYLRERPDADFLPDLQLACEQLGVTAPSNDKLLQLVALLKERAVLRPDLAAGAEMFLVRPSVFDETVVAKKWQAEWVPALKDAAKRISELPGGATAEDIKQAVYDAATAAGVKFGKLMPMLRLALTGQGEGPDMMAVLHWLGAPEVAARLTQAPDKLPA